ncbi:NADPH oxidase organizer 1a [Colossoma macropomum]|uniref:NADPH oxidase organizer 1a n=1 Tax=Colossoma macropomum TaxID=42526 RepID=UPI001864826B|nr:NADPH oxidase organizer 1a [Colossoma macropomum]
MEEEKRYPVNVRLIGVLHKEASKLYMTSVLWSDQNELIIYRNLEDFKTLHKQLKKKFPSSSLRKSERVVPKFKAKVRGAQRKGVGRSVLRLRSLEQYCSALLTEPRIAQSPELSSFLLPRPDDLKPEFAQNSIMIMPSEESLGRSGGRESDAGVTQPFVTETYRCIAAYKTKDTKNRPFKVEADEILDVLIKDKAGWWLVENEAKCLAWFPAPYLEKAEMDYDDDEDLADGECVLYVAARSYKSMNRDELSLEIGSVAEVLQRTDNGWWLVRYNSRTGYVPSMYLQPYNNPQARVVIAQRENRGSSLNLAELQNPGHELSRSQGNLLQLPGNGLRLAGKPKSCSMDVIPHPQASPMAQRVAPTIQVQPAEEGRDRSLSSVSKGSETGFSDDSSSSDNESRSTSPSDIQQSRTPTPIVTGRLTPSSTKEGKLTTSTSDPNMFKLPSTPKVPPRPQAQEILKRCTTITRKNASKNQQSPPLEVYSR